MAFGVLLTINYVKRAFARSLLGDAYQVQSYTENKSEYYPSKNARKCLKKLYIKEAEAEAEAEAVADEARESAAQQMSEHQHGDHHDNKTAADYQIKLTPTDNSLS